MLRKIFEYSIAVSVFFIASQALAATDGRASVKRRSPASAGMVHPCASDALSKALPLLILHFGGDKFDDQTITADNIDQNVKVVKAIKPLTGQGKLDVLEVIGNIYKASYRMHFIYAQIQGTCALMGQEILEMSNPY